MALYFVSLKQTGTGKKQKGCPYWTALIHHYSLTGYQCRRFD